MREGASEESLESSSVSEFDLIAGRSGIRKECRRGAFSASLDEENLDSGGMASTLAIGELSGGQGARSGRLRLIWRGRCSRGLIAGGVDVEP